MKLSPEALTGINNEGWMASLDVPYKETCLHKLLLSNTQISDSTIRKSFGFGVTATKQERLPTKRFYVPEEEFQTQSRLLMQNLNDPNQTAEQRFMKMQKSVVTAAMIVAGDETNPYITIVTNPTITKIDDSGDSDNLGAPRWSDILSEDLADIAGVPYDDPSHLVAAGTGWCTRSDIVGSRDELIHKVQPVLLHPAERLASKQHQQIHHVLFLPALACPPVGLIWPTNTTYPDFVANIKALNGTIYRSFLTVLEVCRSMIEPWFDAVNRIPNAFRMQMLSAQPLLNALPTKENPNPDGVEDESLLDPILELFDQLLWQYYEDRVLTDSESKEMRSRSSSQLHYLLKHGRECFPDSLRSVYGTRFPFLSYFLRPEKEWMMGANHWEFFSDEYLQAQWVLSYSPVKVPVVEATLFHKPSLIRTKLDLAMSKEEDLVLHPPADGVSFLGGLSTLTPGFEDGCAKFPMIPAVILQNVHPAERMDSIRGFITRRLRKFSDGKEIVIVSCRKFEIKRGSAKVLIEFDDHDHAKLAMVLDGFRMSNNLVSVKLVERTDSAKILGLLTSKRPPKGYHRAIDASPWNAHPVLKQKLNNQTKLRTECCIYLRNIVRNYPTGDLLNFIRNKFQQVENVSPQFTVFQVRSKKGDALIEFQDPRHKELASRILNGLTIGSPNGLEVHPWKEEYLEAFLAYFQTGSEQHIRLESDSSANDIDQGGSNHPYFPRQNSEMVNLRQENERLRGTIFMLEKRVRELVGGLLEAKLNLETVKSSANHGLSRATLLIERSNDYLGSPEGSLESHGNRIESPQSVAGRYNVGLGLQNDDSGSNPNEKNTSLNGSNGGVDPNLMEEMKRYYTFDSIDESRPD